MATVKAIVLKNFATIGIPDFESGEESLNKTWSVVGISENLIDEDRLVGLQQLDARRLDLVISNGSKFVHLNLQAFKVFDCEVATDTIRQCVANYLTPDGNLLFGVQPSGDVVVLTDGFQHAKQVRKPSFIKIQQKKSNWYDNIPGKIAEWLGVSRSKMNQVTPEAMLEGIQINGKSTSTPTLAASSITLLAFKENIRNQFPYLTSLIDGMAIFCAFSPTDCFIFLSSYETALRTKSIANIRGSQVPGRWYRIIMHKNVIVKWLEERRTKPFFEARIYRTKDEYGETVISGGLLYATLENLKLDLMYGLIVRRADKYTLSWEVLQYEVDWPLRESDDEPYDLGAKFVTKLSSDCKKMVIGISNHLGMYILVQEIPFYPDYPIPLQRQRIGLCNHCNFDGTHFYKKSCWIADVQWLVEDAYFAVMTCCGSLSIFRSTGEPMIVKVRKPGPDSEEEKSARFYFPVFHPHQICRPQQANSQEKGSINLYPTIKWVDSEQILTCSSGMKVELFSIQRVLPISLDSAQSELWLGRKVSSDATSLANYREKAVCQRNDENENYRKNSRRSVVIVEPDVEQVNRLKEKYSSSQNENQPDSKHGRDGLVMEYRYSREDDNGNANVGFDTEGEEAHSEDFEKLERLYPVNDIDSPSRIEELPPDGGELEEENLEKESFATPEKLRKRSNEYHNVAVEEEVQEYVDADVNNFSLPESLAPGDKDYNNNEYSDGSSEPDVDPDGALVGSSTTTRLEETCLLPEEFDLEDMLADRKCSQQYMADDESDYVEPEKFRRGSRRKSRERIRTSFSSRGKTANDMVEEESDHPPRSSSAYDTEYTQETYSPPFSVAPTSAEGDADGDNEQEEDLVSTYNLEHVLRMKNRSPTPVLEGGSPRSTTAISLQIPPVPKISGVVVSSTRQNNANLQNMEIEPPHQRKQRPELLRHKPPPSAGFNVADSSTISELHFNNKAVTFNMADSIGTQTTTENMNVPCEEGAEYYETFKEKEDENEEPENYIFAMIHGSPTGTPAEADMISSSIDHPYTRHRDSSV